jgi:hypothetical protein
VTIESNSGLTRIEESSFSKCPLKLICIPKFVEFIGGRAFTKVGSMTFEGRRFTFSSEFLIDRIESVVIQYLGKLTGNFVNQDIEILGKSSFDGSQIRSLQFESDSKLRRIEALCFHSSALKSICIPCSVEIICESSFSGCTELEFVSFESNSLLKRLEMKCFADSSIKSICIPRFVSVLGRLCFSNCRKLNVFAFEANSQLKRIEELCFFESKLKSICIPRSVSIIAKKSFLWCRLTNLEFENNSLLREIGTKCFSGSSLKSICIPGLISKLYKSVFLGWRKLERITFEADSKLRDIEDFCFSETSLKHICLPNGVDFLNGTMFFGCPIESITFQSANRRFHASDEFLIDLIEFRLVRYFGKSTEVVISRSIQIFDDSCFANSKLERLSFESDSKLVRIEDRCFYRCPMKVIWIPRHVDLIAGSAFEESAIESIIIEPVNQ